MKTPDPVYILLAYEPYHPDTELFRGSEEGLKAFIKNLQTEEVRTTFSGPTTIKRVAWYHVDDLKIVLEGPDVRDYIE